MKLMYMTNYPEERRFVRIVPSVNGTTTIINYEADNNHLNTFLCAFDIWNSGGEHKISEDKNYSEVWFEASNEFYKLAKTEIMLSAFNKFGVRVVFGR